MVDIDKTNKDWANKHRQYLERERVMRETNVAKNERKIDHDRRAAVFNSIVDVQKSTRKKIFGEVSCMRRGGGSVV